MINYIIKTLQREDYVFIERLGAFRMQLKHAEIDKDTIHPPHYEIVFSQKDSEENNFALANQISRDKQCLFTQANEEITRWVDELLAALQNNKSVTYEDFGTFMLDKKGNISFESAVIPQLNLQFEGLEPIDLKHFEVAAVVEPEPVPVAEPEPEPVVEPDPDPVVEPEPELVVASEPEPVVDLEPEPVVEPEPVPVAELEPEPVVEPEPVPVAEPEPELVVELVGEHDDTPEDDDEEKDKDDDDDDEEEDGKDDDEEEEEDEDDEDDDDNGAKKKHHWAWLWILLLLIAVLAVLGFVFKDKLLDYYHQWKEKKHPVEQVVEPADESTESATLEETAEPVDEYAEREPEPEPEVFTPTVVKQSADGQYDYIRFEQGHYYAIAGSFPNESDVIRHIRQKKLDQYSPKILIQDGVKNLRVCIGVFESEEEAESFAKGINSTYWVLK